jgi:hypothetical protein
MTIEEGKIIKFLGENIFPVTADLLLLKFKLEDLMNLADQKIIIKSGSKIGTNPTMMKTPKGYIELSEKGWGEYDNYIKSKLIQP